MKNNLRKIYVDMDGVLVDFLPTADQLLRSKTGCTFEQLESATAWYLIAHHAPNLYADLKPTKDYLKLWNGIAHHHPIILTALPSLVPMPFAQADKLKWVDQYLGEVDVRFGPYAVDKQKHCLAGDILIDDSHRNIAQWKSKGGYGILHTDAESTLKELEIIFSTEQCHI